MSDAFRSKPALKRCVVCRQPVATKKLVFATDGQPVHRACRTTTDRPPSRPPSRPSARPAAAPTRLTRAPKDISRAELLKRIEALRKRDAKKKPVAVKTQPGGRPKPPKPPHLGKRPVPPPQPYSGVEMKFIGGRWVQMHPDSE
ncbi:hypothetical protein AB0N16_02815 [Streptomyces sp. NPDC051105]|uniref:hypothetical protein n=1 Tax=Streptomyces sp. NPDC051105 TaxID=3154843 RepID=UPI003429F264